MKIYSLDKTDFSLLLAVKKDSFHNSFFYSVRNITIAYFLSEIESYFLGKGHFVQCKWSESSFGGPSIKITLFNPKTKKEYYESSIILKRDSHHLYHDINANVYSIKNISTTSYFPHKHPGFLDSYISDFDLLRDSDFFDYNNICYLNYPFVGQLSNTPEESYILLGHKETGIRSFYSEVSDDDYLNNLIKQGKLYGQHFVLNTIRNHFLFKGYDVDLSATDLQIDVVLTNPTQRGWKKIAFSIYLKEETRVCFVDDFLAKTFLSMNITFKDDKQTVALTKALAIVDDFKVNIIEDLVLSYNYPFYLYSCAI